MDILTVEPNVMPEISKAPDLTPKLLTANRLEALLQKADPFCKRISKCLTNGKAPKHETDIFTHVRSLLYKHVTDSGKNIPCISHPYILEIHQFSGSA